MTRLWKIGIAVLAVLAFAAVLTFPALLHNVLGLRRANRSDEQARRNILPPLSTPTDTREKAQLFWLSPSSPDTLEPATVELNLSADPQERAKQLITALIEQAPSQLERTLPADAVLLQFYLLPNGTAIADFSEALGTETPSGILNEQMAVDSIVRTLAANLSTVYRLKILIRGQDADTLAGHLDLSQFFTDSSSGPSANPRGRRSLSRSAAGRPSCALRSSRPTAVRCEPRCELGAAADPPDDPHSLGGNYALDCAHRRIRHGPWQSFHLLPRGCPLLFGSASAKSVHRHPGQKRSEKDR